MIPIPAPASRRSRLTRIVAAGNMGGVIKRSEVRDRRGRLWTVSVVPTAEADEEDFRFWYEELTPAQRVDLVSECLLSCLKTKGLDALPRFRRVYRRVERKRR
jgi:hypothetical protein